MNYGEPQGQPFIKDILIEDSQVTLLLSQVLTYSCMPDEILPLHMQGAQTAGMALHAVVVRFFVLDTGQ